MSSYFGIAGASLVLPSITPDWNACIPAAMKRRDPRIWHVAYSAAHKVINETGIKPVSIVAGTALGALDETKNFLDTVFDTGFGNPRHFIASVHNSMAGKIALEFQIKGPNLTVCDGQNSLASAVASLDTLDASDFPVLVLLIDEHIPLLDTLHPHFSSLCKEYLEKDWVDGAFAMIIDCDSTKYSKKIRAFGPIPIDTCIDQSIGNLVSINNVTSNVVVRSSSYIDPGVAVHSIIHEPGKSVTVASYAPASNSAAIIEVVSNKRPSVSSHPFFGMHKTDTEDPVAIVDSIRKNRYRDI
jgi:Beta-ketoacyl synthase, N-terminal domain